MNDQWSSPCKRLENDLHRGCLSGSEAWRSRWILVQHLRHEEPRDTGLTTLTGFRPSHLNNTGTDGVHRFVNVPVDLIHNTRSSIRGIWFSFSMCTPVECVSPPSASMKPCFTDPWTPNSWSRATGRWGPLRANNQVFFVSFTRCISWRCVFTHVSLVTFLVRVDFELYLKFQLVPCNTKFVYEWKPPNDVNTWHTVSTRICD